MKDFMVIKINNLYNTINRNQKSLLWIKLRERRFNFINWPCILKQEIMLKFEPTIKSEIKLKSYNNGEERLTGN
jgi:hypothetical protein